MKKLFLTIALAIFMATGLQAQSPFDKFFEKYAGKDGYTSVNISKEMFQMFQTMAAQDQNDAESKEMQQVIEQLTGLKMITYKGDSTKPALGTAFYNEAAALFPSSAYKELMTVNDDGNNIRFMTKQESPKKISEMVMILRGKNETMVMSLTGNIDLATVSKLSKNMNIPGMDHLKDAQKK